MASESSGSKNQPHFSATGAPAIDVDPGLVADYAALVGNRKADTNAVRVALTGNDVWPGLEFYETDTDLVYVYKASGAWALLASPPIAGTITPASGFTLGSATALVARGGRAYMTAQFTQASGTLANPKTVGQLPVGFRPPVTFNCTASLYGAGTPAGFQIYSDGGLAVNNQLAATAISDIWVNEDWEIGG